jgi:integrase
MLRYVFEDNPKTSDITSKHLNEISKILQVIPSRNHIDLKRVNTYELIEKSLNGEYEKYPKLNIETVNKMLRRIRSLSLYGYKTGLFEMIGAVQTLKNHRSFRDERKALEPEEIELISSATDIQEVKDFITLLRYSGMRIGELSKYVFKEIDGIECFDLREAKSLKTMSSFRVIPRHPKIKNIDFTYTYEHLSRMVKRLIDQNLDETDKKTTYSLRHTFASELIKSGVDSVLVSELMGHSHRTMTMNRYVKGYPIQMLKSAIDTL